jgi:transposase
MCSLRAYLRHRAGLLQERAVQILHMQKALHQMTIQLDQVLGDITGQTGLAIVRAIIEGERDGLQLAQFRDFRCKSSQATLAKAWTGNWKPEYLFALKQSVELYDFYTQQVSACDVQLEQQYATMKPRWEHATEALEPASALPRRQKRKSKNSPPFDVL